MKQQLPLFAKNFLKCGLTGWCIEIVFTALGSLRSRDFTLRGNTSLWMFPIYGCAAAIAPVSRLLKKKPPLVRGLVYMSLIFTAEYASGCILSRRRLCPWDYGKSRWHVKRVIRLDYAPFWFGAGLLFERLLGAPGNNRPAEENALQ